MGGNGEIVSAGNFFLKLFDEGMGELDDFSALGADHVVVMTMHVFMFIAFLSVAKIHFRS